jgi:hypothetical protein
MCGTAVVAVADAERSAAGGSDESSRMTCHKKCGPPVSNRWSHIRVWSALHGGVGASCAATIALPGFPRCVEVPAVEAAAERFAADKMRTPEDEAIAAMAGHGYQPLEPYPGTTSKRWRCRCVTCGHEETLTLASVRSGKRCLFCAGLRTHPEQAAVEMRAAGVEPLEPYPGLANSPRRCRCLTCGAEVRPSLTNARIGEKGLCRRCGIERLRAAKLIPESVARQEMLDAGLEPLEPYDNSQVGWRCRCLTCGAEAAPSLASVRRGGGCRKCGRKTTGDKLRTPESEAVAAMVARGYAPLEPYPGANVKRCQCVTCGRESTPTLGNVRSGMGCGWCAGHRSDPDEVVAVMRSLGVEPLEPYRSANLPWRCRCNACGNEITPTYANARKFSPCRYCAPFGFNLNDPAVVYLLQHGRRRPLRRPHRRRRSAVLDRQRTGQNRRANQHQRDTKETRLPHPAET